MTLFISVVFVIFGIGQVLANDFPGVVGMLSGVYRLVWYGYTLGEGAYIRPLEKPASIAQRIRAFDYESKGCRFESC